MNPDDEDELLRSVALQNAHSILIARQRAEQELIQAKEALEKKTQELAHSLSMMRATLESTTDAIIVTDREGLITGFNEKFVEMWRIPRDIMNSRQHGLVREVISQSFENPLAWSARIEEIYASSPPESFDILELTDGRIIERFSKIQSLDGKTVGRVWSFRDITERRLLDRRKDEFLAVVAHELRTPLSAVLLAARLLQSGKPSEANLLKFPEIIVRQTMQLSKLVDDLLDVGRITAGKLQLDTKRVELNTILKQAAEACAPLIERRGHRLHTDFVDPPLYVNVDAARMVQVFSNLLNNAAKYTHQPGQIELAAFENRGNAVISVRDQGVGITEEMLGRIFQRFVQVGTSGRRADGLGIGLSVVKALVEMHGGTVEAASSGIGKGSEFTVHLPLFRDPGLQI